ncbi:MAG: AAA family ATPase [Gammaproteobacteria bacterium]|nr:AAA family ATPase [Gammaproteobacteria bacterium]
MYLQYFGLRENPFSIPPDPNYLYLSRGHLEALAHLQYGLGEGGGFAQLTGEVGTGKTLLIRALVERLPDEVDIALILYPVLTVAEFVAAICDELQIPRPSEHASLKRLIDALNVQLLQNHARGRRTVLIIDEAQNLNREVLEQIRLLTNLETTKQKLLQIILIGQPELSSLLAQRDLRQLAQRITARYHLAALTRKETFDYIVHRCRVAGAKTTLFERTAMERVYSISGGIPRLINIICDRALLGAYTREKSTVDVSIVRRAAAEVGSTKPKRRWLTPVTHVLLPTAMTAALLAGAWLWWSGAAKSPSANEAVSATTPVAAQENNNIAVAQVAAAKTSAPEITLATPANTKPVVTLESLLANAEVTADTESAMKHLFERWNLDYAVLKGKTGCERALNAGLHCLYKVGAWSSLRSYNRPAIIELQDTAGRKYHALVAALKPDAVVLELGGQQYDFPLSEVDRVWFGKYLLLWKPTMPEEAALHLGDRGESVIWLRDALARYRGEPLVAEASDLFDQELQQQLRNFQSRQQLVSDGVAGRISLARLQSYLPGGSPTLVADATTPEAR